MTHSLNYVLTVAFKDDAQNVDRVIHISGSQYRMSEDLSEPYEFYTKSGVLLDALLRQVATFITTASTIFLQTHFFGNA